jgi:hypothetical protein
MRGQAESEVLYDLGNPESIEAKDSKGIKVLSPQWRFE